MSDDVLETYIRRVIDDTPSSEVSFCWQGGEPTLCGLSFYQKVVRLQQRYANGKTIYGYGVTPDKMRKHRHSASNA
ncbi:hypothetical protein JYY36_000054 [Salmonella enterica subsp. diarizonae serovar 50:z:-]|nr:hypothetical protein [Salmonella enterica]EDC7488969.1 hypothetical protein [Salmonella enterica]EHC2384150.1 hypothetical protein [Salmonella enterica]EHC9773060.1 hypothetical protein [Salmonella enterica subsp. diarizonae serovar 50:z:-]